MDTNLQQAWNESFVDKSERPRMIGLLYGEFGSWKTVTAASCIDAIADNANALLVAADRGWESLRNHPSLFERVRVLNYMGLSQLNFLADSADLLGTDLLIIDTLTQIQEEYIDFLMDNVTWGGKAYREKTQPNPGSKVKPEEIPSMPDYHLARNKLRIPLRKIMSKEIDVIFTCHVREPNFMEQQKGVIVRRPSLTQKLYEYVAREAHFIGFMEKTSKSPVATINFKTDPRTVAKSRIELIQDKKIPATELPTLLRKWKENA